MTPDTTDRFVRSLSIGIDAVSLDRYSDIDIGDVLMISDDQREDGWIQCEFWIPADPWRTASRSRIRTSSTSGTEYE
jgi:hypothetical protein